MKKQKLIGKCICLLALLFSLSGCWDQKELEKKAYVIAIGVDKADDELVKVTYLIANPEYGSQQQGGATNEPPEEIITFETTDFISSRNLANVVVAKEITYDLLRVLIVSEDFAKENDFIRWMYDATKDREIRRDISFIVVNGEADHFLEKNKPKLETKAHKYFELILQRGEETGMVPESDLLRFFQRTEADADLFLAIYGANFKKVGHQKETFEDNFYAGQFHPKGKTNNTQFTGSAVFKEGKMIGKLTGEETRLAIILDNTLNSSDVLATYPDPFDKKQRITARIEKKRSTKIKMDLHSPIKSVNVKVPLTVEILTDHSMANYAISQKKRDILKQSLEKALEKKLEELVRRTQKEFKGEPFGWSLVARKEFLTIDEYTKFDWMKTYPNMKVTIDVDIQLTEFGRQSELPSMKEMRD